MSPKEFQWSLVKVVRYINSIMKIVVYQKSSQCSRISFNIKSYILGSVNSDLNFEYGADTRVYGGCAVTFMGHMWYFGGDGAHNGIPSYTKQVCIVP